MIDQTVLDTRGHLELTADGLSRFSRYSRDGGYSIAFTLIHGWQRGYVETTGYIIPTALDLAAALGRADLRDDALRHGEWLLEHQQADGGFPDIAREESYAFDTGQVLMGLTRLLRETNDDRYAEAARRTCDWLCSLRQSDGSWGGRGDTRDRSPTYLTRSAAALLRHGKLIGEQRYVDDARAFLDWTLTQQMPSGLFRQSELNPADGYLLHTIVYVLEGLLDAYEDTGEPRYLDAVMRGAEPLRDISLHREVVLHSHYDAELGRLTEYKCITGLAQWAGVCLRLHRIGGDPGFLESASNAIFYVKTKQLRVGGMLRGLLPGSIPIWGDYLKLSYPNWNLKFFGDTLLLWEAIGEGKLSHQETWVKTSHAVSAGRVGWNEVKSELGVFDYRVLERMRRTIEKQVPLPQDASILDVGCGEGRYLQWFAEKGLGGKRVGVDPLLPESGNVSVLQGTAHRIPLPDRSIDCAYASIALQHVADLPGALTEVGRVLKPGGVFIVLDRNPVSIRGLTKRWHEARGRWLYAWDAPFRERWRTLGAWANALRRSGFRVLERAAFNQPAGSGLRRLLPINRFIYVAARKVD